MPSVCHAERPKRWPRPGGSPQFSGKPRLDFFLPPIQPHARQGSLALEMCPRDAQINRAARQSPCGF